jgi:predicted transcriptional regulator
VLASVKLSNELWARVQRVAAARGYSSPEEFVEHVLERETAETEETEGDQKVIERLKGLGYID